MLSAGHRYKGEIPAQQRTLYLPCQRADRVGKRSALLLPLSPYTVSPPTLAIAREIASPDLSGLAITKK
jgi:hypothetical protein